MKNGFLLIILFGFQSIALLGQPVKIIKFGEGGKIEIPSYFTNADVGNYSSKIVIIKANGNVDGYNFYVKFSFLQKEKSYTIQELRNNKEMIFENLNQDLLVLRNEISKIGGMILNTYPNQFVEVDKAVGGQYSYTYNHPKTGIRQTRLYQLYYEDKVYFLTFGWSKEIEAKSNILLKKIINSIVF